ncbi:hypothetical protein ACQCWI_27970 [Bacillus thuringiensis]|uniref:hypothetical protein n=1 Tax=Bacillus thuringiensis TaxID=1428 RepID=UPI003CF4FC88
MAVRTEKMKQILECYSEHVTENQEVIIGLEDGMLILSSDPIEKGNFIIRIQPINERLNWSVNEVLGAMA